MLKISKKLSKKGFSLIELMIAISILIFVVAGIFHAYSISFMGMADSRDRTIATNYARELMEDIKNKDFDQIITQSRNYIDGTKYEREVIVQSETNLKKVATNVYWKDRNGNEKIVETDMAVYFIKTTAGIATRIMLIAEPDNVLTENIINTPEIVDERKSTITAVVKDVKGNTDTTYSGEVTFSISVGDTYGSLQNNYNTHTVSSIKGIATTTFTASSKGEVEIKASASGLNDDSFTIKITDAGEAVRINLTADTYFMAPSTNSTSLITAKILDAGNSLVESATNKITFSFSGPGALSSPTTKPAVNGEATKSLTSDGAPGTITVTASSSGLVPDYVTVVTGGKIDLFTHNNNVPVNGTAAIGVTTKNLYGILVNYKGIIILSVIGYTEDPEYPPGEGTLSSYSVSFNGDTYLKTVDFIATSEGKVKITATDEEGILDLGELILTINPALVPHHIDVSADPSSIEAGGNISIITAKIKTSAKDGNITVTSYDEPITFVTNLGTFSNIEKSITLYNSDENYNKGVATDIFLYSSVTAGTATVNVSSGALTGSTDVGFYSGADHIDLAVNPQSILSGGGSKGTCTITATVKDGINVVTGYDGTITLFIESGHPNGVVFVTTNKSSVTMDVVNGKAEIDLLSKNWTGIARIKATAFDGIKEIEEYLNIPVVANKDLEIFLLYKNDLNRFLNYYYPNNGLYKGNWDPGSVYGKFCVDNINNLYILDGDYIKKKNSRGDLIGTSAEIASGNYAINIGPDGYIYFSQNLGTEEAPEYCIKKLNPNSLILEDILNLKEDEVYYGFAIDPDSNEYNTFIYIHNHTNQTIEKRSFETGDIVTLHGLTYNYNLSELAVAGEYIVGIEKKGNDFKILKTLEENETSFGLTNITNPLCISSIDGDFLFAGLNASNHIIFERYGSANWDKTIDDKEYLDCIIGAYPF